MTSVIIDEIFHIKGHCPKCGGLLGSLKNVGTAYVAGSYRYRLHDPVVYHVAVTIIDTRMKCPEKSQIMQPAPALG